MVVGYASAPVYTSGAAKYSGCGMSGWEEAARVQHPEQQSPLVRRGQAGPLGQALQWQANHCVRIR
jgi:hypothetical protein